MGLFCLHSLSMVDPGGSLGYMEPLSFYHFARMRRLPHAREHESSKKNVVDSKTPLQNPRSADFN